MFCKNCGKEIEDGAKFCPSCGKPLEESNSSVAGDDSTRKIETFNGGKDNGVASDAKEKLKDSLSGILSASNATKAAAEAAAGDANKVVIVDTAMKIICLVASVFFGAGSVLMLLDFQLLAFAGALILSAALFLMKNAFAHGYIIDTAGGTFSFAAVQFYRQTGLSPVDFVKTLFFGGEVALSEIQRIEIENGVHYNRQNGQVTPTKKLAVYGTFGHLKFYFGSHEKLTEVATALSVACHLQEDDA